MDSVQKRGLIMNTTRAHRATYQEFDGAVLMAVDGKTRRFIVGAPPTNYVYEMLPGGDRRQPIRAGGYTLTVDRGQRLIDAIRKLRRQELGL